MRWPRRKPGEGPPPPLVTDPLVLAVTTALDERTAAELRERVQSAPPGRPVVIDVTAIPAFDSAGAEALSILSDRDDVSVVGFRQAATRIVGSADAEPDAAAKRSAGWVMRGLHNLVVVQPEDPQQADPAGLERALAEPEAADVAIVVLDLRDVQADAAQVTEAVAFASSGAAVRGQELLIVNATQETADQLRTAGLSATTYVAPPPPLS